MSWNYVYYLTYKNKEDGKLYPLGPFDYKGEYFSVLDKSHSFTSDLHERFINAMSEEARQIFSSELFDAISNVDEENKKEFFEGKGYWCWSYLPYKDLPSGDYVKSGYVLIEEIEEFEDPENNFWDGFYGVLSPEIYAKKLENELKFGRPRPQKDEYGEEYIPHSMSDYSFYRWIDTRSEEYDAHVIREAVDVLRWDAKFSDPKDEIYIVLTQG